MKSSVFEVGGMLSALSAHGVEKQLMKLQGVEKAEVNYVGGSATVIYDEKVIGLKEITLRIHGCGYQCGGESLPKHVCRAGAN
jgi:Cu2+-exporting ATPase